MPPAFGPAGTGRPEVGGAAQAIFAYRAQGRYIAAVRRLPKAMRATVKAIRQRPGVATAVAAARRMGK